MEYSVWSSPLLMSIVTASLVIVAGFWLYLRRPWSENEKRSRTVPGGSRLPLIGDTIAFVQALSTDSLYSFYSEKVAKYGPLFKLSLFGTTVVVMDPPGGHKFFFSNENKLLTIFSPPVYARMFGPDSIALKTGEPYRISRRHLVSTFLGLDTVWRFISKVEALSVQHLEDNWHQNSEICSVDMMRNLTFSLILQLIMSVTGKEQVEELLHAYSPWVEGLLKLPINLPGFAYHRSLKARVDLHRILDRYISQRRQELQDGTATPNQDLLSALLTQPDEEGHMYTDGEIKDNMQFLFVAGYATSSSVLTLMIANIAKHPEVYDDLIEEHSRIAATKEDSDPLTVEHVRSMEYTWRVAQETMRLTPIADVALRVAIQDFQYNGYTIPKGWKLVWSQSRCSRDETFFKNPERFDPARFDRNNPAPTPYTFLPFGAGPRSCPGNEFAKMEILVFIHHLLKNFKWTVVTPDSPMFRNFTPYPKESMIRVTKFKAF